MMVDEYDIDRLQQEHERLADEAQGSTDWSTSAFSDLLQVLREICWIGAYAVFMVLIVALALSAPHGGATLP